MKKISLTLILACVIFSCEYSTKSLHLDLVKFVQMKENWEKKNINNYSFTYSFDTYMPSAYIGYVKVSNGVGSVTFEGEPHHKPDVNRSYDKKFYITSIEEVFNYILYEYTKAKKELDEGKYAYIRYYPVDYDNEYFFPTYAHCYRGLKKDPGDGYYGGATLKIKDFKVSD